MDGAGPHVDPGWWWLLAEKVLHLPREISPCSQAQKSLLWYCLWDGLIPPNLCSHNIVWNNTGDRVAAGSVFVPADAAQLPPVVRESYDNRHSAQRRVITRPSTCSYPLPFHEGDGWVGGVFPRALLCLLRVSITYHGVLTAAERRLTNCVYGSVCLSNISTLRRVVRCTSTTDYK